MGRCVKALVLKAPVTDLKPSTIPCAPSHVNGALLEWYSCNFNALRHNMRLVLDCPGTSELLNMMSIVSSDVGSSDVNVLPSEVRDVAQQSLVILSRTANLHLDQPIAQLDIPDARIGRLIVSQVRNLLQKCIPGASTLTTYV